MEATPCAELDILMEGDEQKLGLTYRQCHLINKERMIFRSGPLLLKQDHISDCKNYAANFLSRFGVNRHKANILTKAFHFFQYDTDPKHSDQRPLIYDKNSLIFINNLDVDSNIHPNIGMGNKYS